MDLLQHIQNIKEGVSIEPPSSEELTTAFKTFFNKKAVKESLADLKKRLVSISEKLSKYTIRLRKGLGEPDTIERLNKLTRQNKSSAYWRSRLLNVELLGSAIQQLRDSTTRIQILMSMARLVSVVEDLDEPVEAGALGGERGPHNNIYKYLMQMEAWTPARVQEFNGIVFELGNQLVQSLADRILKSDASKLAKSKRSKPMARPSGW